MITMLDTCLIFISDISGSVLAVQHWVLSGSEHCLLMDKKFDKMFEKLVAQAAEVETQWRSFKKQNLQETRLREIQPLEETSKRKLSETKSNNPVEISEPVDIVMDNAAVGDAKLLAITWLDDAGYESEK